jgi:hypothetical protein
LVTPGQQFTSLEISGLIAAGERDDAVLDLRQVRSDIFALL